MAGTNERVKIKGWRKIAAATWGQPNDPQIYGDLEVDATPLLDFMEEAKQATGTKLTITHMVGKAIAYALAEHPELNVRLYRGHFIPRETVDIFFIVSADAGAELSGVKVVDTDKKSAVEIAQELADRAKRIRTGTDEEFGKTKSMLAKTPTKLLNRTMRAAAWITTDRDKDMKSRGLPRQPFGSAMITSVGMFGIQHAYAPLSPVYRIPFLILVGEVAEKPVAVDGEVVIRKMLTLSATMDHRYVDGFHAAKLANHVKAYCAEPKRFEPAL